MKAETIRFKIAELMRKQIRSKRRRDRNKLDRSINRLENKLVKQMEKENK